MKSNRSERRFFSIHSLDFSSDKPTNSKPDDAISFRSLSLDPNVGLHYVNTLVHNRSNSTKRLLNSVINNGKGLIINGSFFDEQLFQPTRSSYVTDYTNTPDDFNRFLQGHNISSSSKTSQLDSHLFKSSFIITLSEWHVDKELLLGYCPHEDNNDKILQEISYYKRFCFPELNSKQKNGGTILNDPSTYIFTRTLENGHVEYGYCRRLTKDYNQITNCPIVICIVSTYPYYKLYDAILNELTSAYMSNELECNLLMQSFYSKPLPIPRINSSGITCILNDRRIFYYICPRDDRLNHDYFSTLLSCLTPNQIIYLFESMLRSKRLLIFSQYPSKLTKSCLGLSLLIYPFIWPYSFASLMPSSWLHDLLDSPCPFIYGCLDETIDQLPSTMDNDTICVNLDTSVIESNETKSILPLNLRQILESSLEYLTRFRLIKSDSMFLNIAISEAFLYVLTELFYRLPEFFKREKVVVKNDKHFAVCSNYFKRQDSGIDLQSLVSDDVPQPSTTTTNNDNHFGYEFHSEDFLRVQPTSAYVLFLKEFIQGMIFLKFLDDYQRNDNFSLFSQRLNERRQMSFEDLSINPVIKYRQTVDLLEKQLKQSSKQNTPTISKFLKKFFE